MMSKEDIFSTHECMLCCTKLIRGFLDEMRLHTYVLEEEIADKQRLFSEY